MFGFPSEKGSILWNWRVFRIFAASASEVVVKVLAMVISWASPTKEFADISDSDTLKGVYQGDPKLF